MPNRTKSDIVHIEVSRVHETTNKDGIRLADDKVDFMSYLITDNGGDWSDKSVHTAGDAEKHAQQRVDHYRDRGWRVSWYIAVGVTLV